MGCCLSNDPASAKSNDVDKDLKKAKGQDKYTKKLLFLGSGGSGKSTLFKQLRTIHGNGWSREDRLTFVDHIHAQIIEQMKLAIDCVEYPAGDDEDDDNNNQDQNENESKKSDAFAQLSSQAKEAVNIIQGVKDPKV